jgi:hypothetical protein
MGKKKHQEVILSLAAAFLLHAVKELVPECPQLTGQLLAAQTFPIHAAQHFLLLLLGMHIKDEYEERKTKLKEG